MIYSVHQPHYLPYPGYLAKVALSDAFVFLEGVQFVRREWQNRNRIKGPAGEKWLTVPVKGVYGASIDTIEIDDSQEWRRKHVETLNRFYARAPYLNELDGFAEVIGRGWGSLAELAIATTSHLLDRFAITTPRSRMADYDNLPEEPNLRIIAIGKAIGADVYLAGSGGRQYMNLELFQAAGIEVRFFDPPSVSYPQLHGDFIPNLGGIDLLLNTGRSGFDTHIRPQLRA